MMNRRYFLSLSGFSLSSLLFISKCSTVNINEEMHDLSLLQDDYISKYNNGAIEQILSNFYNIKCTYMSDSISGDYQTASRILKILYKYHSRNEYLPLKIQNRKISIEGNIGWISFGLTNNLNNAKHGYCTQIFKKENLKWLIIHDHFSS